MKRRISALLLVTVIAVGLAGCGGPKEISEFNVENLCDKISSLENEDFLIGEFSKFQSNDEEYYVANVSEDVSFSKFDIGKIEINDSKHYVLIRGKENYKGFSTVEDIESLITEIIKTIGVDSENAKEIFDKISVVKVNGSCSYDFAPYRFNVFYSDANECCFSIIDGENCSKYKDGNYGFETGYMLNCDYGLSIRIPASWEKDQGVSASIHQYYPDPDNHTKIFCYTYAIGDDVSINNEMSLNELAASLNPEDTENFTLIKNERRTNENGLEYQYIEDSYEKSGNKYNAKTAVFDCNGGIVMLYLLQLEGQNETDYTKDFQKIVDMVMDDGLKTGKETTAQENPKSSTTSTPTYELSEDAKIRSTAREICIVNYDNTDVSNITVNENLGTDLENDYILLVYLTWNVKNHADTTKQMLSMYSEDFAARVGTELPNVSEISIFWKVPYYSDTENVIKYSYARQGNGMYETDEMISDLLK